MILAKFLIFWLAYQSCNVAAESRGLVDVLYNIILDRNITPDHSRAKEVQFFLYARKDGKTESTKIDFNDPKSVKDAGFNPNRKVIFFIHGWGQSTLTTFPMDVINAHLDINPDNIIIAVDWRSLAQSADFVFGNFDPAVKYVVAAVNTEVVGYTTGDVIAFLIKNQLTTLDRVRIIGFSLGAHVAGFAGQKVIQTVNGKISLIIGLDPAGPGFYPQFFRHLAKGDSEFVITLHTDSGRAGTTGSLGDVSFILNRGHAPQPGCLEPIKNAVDFLDRIRLLLSGTCSHNAAHEVYKQSIKVEITATKCGSFLEWCKGLCKGNPTALFGDRTPTNIGGSYFFSLNKTEPPSCFEIGLLQN